MVWWSRDFAFEGAADDGAQRYALACCCDVATVENGVVKSHHFYFDQMDFFGQFGLAPDA